MNETFQTYSSQNVDPSETYKFSEIAHLWWDPTGPVKTLHEINPLRLKYILDHLSLENKKVLDIGCGGGILSEGLAQQKANVTAIDADQELIKMAKLHLYESKLTIDYQTILIEDFAKEHSNEFDAICCMEMLEHVPNPKSVIKHMADVAKPGALLFLSTLNRNFKSWLYAIIGAEYILNLIPKGTHRYDKFITPAEIQKLGFPNQLRLLDMQGITYNPLSQKYNLTPDVSVNYLCCFIKE